MQGMSAWEIRKDVVQYSNLSEYERMVEQENKPTLLDKIVAAAKSIIPTALSTANAALAQLSYSGSVGNFQSASEVISLTARFHPIVAQSPAKIGSPCYKNAYINTLSGFVKCQNAVFGANGATVTEEQAIESFMNNGFFYE